jgi:DNA-binding transcriptional ArsR family regulator
VGECLYRNCSRLAVRDGFCSSACRRYHFRELASQESLLVDGDNSSRSVRHNRLLVLTDSRWFSTGELYRILLAEGFVVRRNTLGADLRVLFDQGLLCSWWVRPRNRAAYKMWKRKKSS